MYICMNRENITLREGEKYLSEDIGGGTLGQAVHGTAWPDMQTARGSVMIGSEGHIVAPGKARGSAVR